ncbi:MAG: tyrosine-protein phosphatase [Clostridia bacterium]|nr:tyrosine-protein phosphatase [Clostridia bacterium]
MKRRLLFCFLLVALLTLVFTGCDVINSIIGKDSGKEEHEHTGGSATCLKAAVCDECGESYGEKLDHDFSDATCTSAKACKACGLVEGKELGHDFADATCTEPKTCVNCGITEGVASHSYNAQYSHDDNGHWIECSRCGDKLDEAEHTGGEATVNERAKCEICGARYGEYPDLVIDWQTEALLPTDGAIVYLANDRIRKWYEAYDYKTTDTDAHWLESDIFTPSVPVFKWSVGEAAKYYKVYVANNSAFNSAQCYLTNLAELSVEHLYVDTTYYWYVDAVYGDHTVRSEIFSFTTAKTPRTVCIDGVSNSRDIGGYITADGKRIKQGMVYRSAKLDDITELGKYTLVNILGVKTDLDLRGARTSDGNGGYYSNLKNTTHPVSELEHITVAAPWYSTGENGIWYDEFNKDELAKAVKVFADPDNYPIIFHCSLGRDRTGTLALVLGGLLGLDENTLMMEYELSVFSYWGAYGSTKYNDGLRNSIHNTYLYIDNNYEGDTFSEKVEDFLLDIGVTADEIASIKDIMLEEVE